MPRLDQRNGSLFTPGETDSPAAGVLQSEHTNRSLLPVRCLQNVPFLPFDDFLCHGSNEWEENVEMSSLDKCVANIRQHLLKHSDEVNFLFQIRVPLCAFERHVACFINYNEKDPGSEESVPCPLSRSVLSVAFTVEGGSEESGGTKVPLIAHVLEKKHHEINRCADFICDLFLAF